MDSIARSSTSNEAASRRLARRNARRSVWLLFHKWLGLALGLWLSLIGLTGAVLVFYEELDEALNPELYGAPKPGQEAVYRTDEEIFSVGRAAMPTDAKLASAYYPSHQDAAYLLYFSRPGKAGGDDIWQVFVNPYTADVIGKRLTRPSGEWFANNFISIIFDLHDNLLLSWKIGGPLVGYIAVALLISVASGLILWWPRGGKWRRALTIKRNASAERFNHDLHQVSGFYTWVVLLALLISGISFNLPQTYSWLVRQFSPGTVAPETVTSVPAPGAAPITMGQAIAIAHKHTPEGRLNWLTGANAADAAYTVCKNRLFQVNRFADHRCVMIDQYSGKILHVTDTVSGTNGDAFTTWMWPLHSGQAFGWPGRILVMLSGLACPVMFVTGVIRWLHKKRARKVVLVRRAARPRP